MPHAFLTQLHYGAAASAVSDCDLPRYLGALLRMAAVHEVSVAERNVAASVAFVLADELTRRLAFAFGDTPLEELLEPLRQPLVSLSLMRDACQVAWADGQLDDQERDLLARMAELLGVSPQQTARLQELVSQQYALHQQTLACLSPTGQA